MAEQPADRIEGGTKRMNGESPLWCSNDEPHGEHWRQNEFNGRDYCSGRPDQQKGGLT